MKKMLRRIVMLIMVGGLLTLQPAWSMAGFKGLLFDTPRLASSRLALSKTQPYLLAHPYSASTYDDAFKAVMMNPKSRQSFFSCIISESIQSSVPLGLVDTDARAQEQVDTDIIGKFLEHYRPLVEDHLAQKKPSKGGSKHPKGLSVGKFFDEWATKFYEPLCRLFPAQDKKAILDFACRLEDGEKIFVELQVRPQWYWDQRALAYAANRYSCQLLEGQSWSLLKKVYAINILGGYELSLEKEARYTWGDSLKGRGFTPSVMKWYRLVNRYENKEEIPELQVIQLYPQLYDEKTTDMSVFGLKDEQIKVLRQWLSLFKDAHHKTEQQVEAEAVDEGVKEAYAILRRHEPTEKYKKWRDLYGRKYAEGIVQAEEEARVEGKMEGLLEGKMEGEVKTLIGLIKRGRLSLEDVMQSSDYSSEIKREIDKRLKE